MLTVSASPVVGVPPVPAVDGATEGARAPAGRAAGAGPAARGRRGTRAGAGPPSAAVRAGRPAPAPRPPFPSTPSRPRCAGSLRAPPARRRRPRRPSPPLSLCGSHFGFLVRFDDARLLAPEGCDALSTPPDGTLAGGPEVPLPLLPVLAAPPPPLLCAVFLLPFPPPRFWFRPAAAAAPVTAAALAAVVARIESVRSEELRLATILSPVAEGPRPRPVARLLEGLLEPSCLLLRPRARPPAVDPVLLADRDAVGDEPVERQPGRAPCSNTRIITGIRYCIDFIIVAVDCSCSEATGFFGCCIMRDWMNVVPAARMGRIS